MLMVPEAEQPGCGKGAAVIQAVYNTSNYYIKISLSHAYGSLFGHQKAEEN